MSRVLLDSDVLIDLLRGREATRAFLREVTEHAVPCCSVISVAEIHAGMRPEERDHTATLFNALVIFQVTRPIAELAGDFRRRARARKLELTDCLIAATAMVESASLATGNIRDYPMPELTVLEARR